MRKTIVTALAVIAATAASASDLPKKTAPVPPVFDRPVAVDQFGYFGVNGGASTGSNRSYSGGLTLGYSYGSYLNAEAYYDYVRPDGARNTDKHQFGLNLLPKYRLGNSGLTVYALAGAGDEVSEKGKTNYTYSYGGGLKYDVTKNVELDARYRRIDYFLSNPSTGHKEDRVTVGLGYKF
jgi:opacity protein-like surface antigen